MNMCNRCGNPIGDHLKPEFKKICAAARSHPATVKVAQQKAIKRIYEARVRRGHNPKQLRFVH